MWSSCFTIVFWESINRLTQFSRQEFSLLSIAVPVILDVIHLDQHMSVKLWTSIGPFRKGSDIGLQLWTRNFKLERFHWEFTCLEFWFLLFVLDELLQLFAVLVIEIGHARRCLGIHYIDDWASSEGDSDGRIGYVTKRIAELLTVGLVRVEF